MAESLSSESTPLQCRTKVNLNSNMFSSWKDRRLNRALAPPPPPPPPPPLGNYNTKSIRCFFSQRGAVLCCPCFFTTTECTYPAGCSTAMGDFYPLQIAVIAWLCLLAGCSKSLIFHQCHFPCTSLDMKSWSPTSQVTTRKGHCGCANKKPPWN